MKKIFFLCFFALITVLYSKENISQPVLVKDFHENKTVKNMYFKESNMINGPVMSFHSNGKLSVIGWFTNGKRENKWVFYKKGTGKIYAVENYKNDKLNGEQKYYYDNGKLRTIGEYVDNNPTGTWEIYDKDGILEARYVYLDSIGKVSIVLYRENGKILCSGMANDNGKTGIWKYYDSNGILVYDINYIDNIRNGAWNAYTKDGKVFLSGTYYNKNLTFN